MSTPRDFQAFNARKPVAHLRFRDVETWQRAELAAAKAGLTMSAWLHSLVTKAVNDGTTSKRNGATHNALATERAASPVRNARTRVRRDE